jgi:hypothetical protein
MKRITGVLLAIGLTLTGNSSHANEIQEKSLESLHAKAQQASGRHIPGVFDVVVSAPDTVFWNKNYVVKIEIKKFSASRCFVTAGALTGPPYFEKQVWVNMKNRKGSATFKFAWDGAIGTSRTMIAWANCGKGANMFGGQYQSDRVQHVGIR